MKNVLIDTINIKKFLVLNPDEGHVNRIPPRKNFMGQVARPNKKNLCALPPISRSWQTKVLKLLFYK